MGEKVGEIGEGDGCKRLNLSEATLIFTKDFGAMLGRSPLLGRER